MRPTLFVMLSLFACADPPPSPQVCYGTFLPKSVEPIVVQGRAQTVSFTLAGCATGFADLTPHLELNGPHLPADGEVVATDAGVDLTFTPQEAGWYDVRVQYGPKRTFQTRVLSAIDRTGSPPALIEAPVASLAVTSLGGIAWVDASGHGWFQRGALRWPMDWGAAPVGSDDVLWTTSAQVHRYVDTGAGPPVESPVGGLDVGTAGGFWANGGNLLVGAADGLHRVYVGDGALVLDDRTWPSTSGVAALAPHRPEVWTAASSPSGGAQRCSMDLDRDSGWSCTGAGGAPLGFDTHGFWYLDFAVSTLVHTTLDPIGPERERTLSMPGGFCAFNAFSAPLPTLVHCAESDDDRVFVPHLGADQVLLEDWGLHSSDGPVTVTPGFIAQWTHDAVRVWTRPE